MLENLATLLPVEVSARVCMVILFVSMSAGNLRFDSDLDLAVDEEAALGNRAKLDLVAGPAEVLGRPVDYLIRRRQANPCRGKS